MGRIDDMSEEEVYDTFMELGRQINRFCRRRFGVRMTMVIVSGWLDDDGLPEAFIQSTVDAPHDENILETALITLREMRHDPENN